MIEKGKRAQSQDARSRDQCRSALDGPECIEGVKTTKKPDQAKEARRACHSALDAPECIEGVDRSK